MSTRSGYVAHPLASRCREDVGAWAAAPAGLLAAVLPPWHFSSVKTSATVGEFSAAGSKWGA